MRSILWIVACSMLVAGCAGPGPATKPANDADGQGPPAPAPSPGPSATEEPPKDPKENAGPEPEPGRAAEREPVTAEMEFLWAAGAGVPGVSGATIQGSDRVLQLEVPEDAVRLEVEAGWGCLHPVCQAGVYAYGPGWQPALVYVNAFGPPQAEASGDGQAALSVQNPAPGTWSIFVNPEGPQVSAKGSVRATAYFG